MYVIIVETDDFGKYNPVLLQLRLDFTPAGRFDDSGNPGKKFLHRRFPETLATQVFDNHIYICPIDRTGAHLKGLFVYFIFRDRHVVSPVEIRNDAARKVRVGVAVLIHQVIDQVERLELVVRIVVPVVMVSIEIPHGHLAVLLVMELALGLILFCLLLEDGVPTVNLVECLVKQFLLHLAIEPVLFRNLVLVSHLYAQDTGKQVGSVTGLGHCRLHICWILSVRNYLV